MSSNASLSVRIPQELLARMEAKAKETGRSKTEILIHALSDHLDFPVQCRVIKEISTNDSVTISRKEFDELVDRVSALEKLTF